MVKFFKRPLLTLHEFFGARFDILTIKNKCFAVFLACYILVFADG